MMDLAEVLTITGRYSEAEPLFRRALAISMRAQPARDVGFAHSLTSLAWFLDTVGRYAEAKPLYRQALAIYEEALERAVTKSKKGKGQQTDAERAVAVVRRPSGREQAMARTDDTDIFLELPAVAEALYVSHRYAEAEPLYRRMLVILEKTPSAGTLIANTLHRLASVLYHTGRYAEAEPLFRRALAIREKALPFGHPNIASSLNGLGAVLRTTGRHAEAEPLHIRAHQIWARSSSPRDAVTGQHNLMHFYAPTKPTTNFPRNLPLSIFYGKQAVNTLQSLRAGLAKSDAATQQAFLDSVKDSYTGLADRLIEAGRIPEAQQVLAMLKEQEFFEFIRRDASAGADPRSTVAGLTPPEARADTQLRSASQNLFTLGQELAALRKKRQYATLSQAEQARFDELGATDGPLARAETEFLATLESIKQAFSRLTEAERSEQARIAVEEDLSGLMADLSARGQVTVLLQTITLDDSLRLLLTSAETRKAYRIPIDRKTLNQRIEAFTRALRSPRIDPRPAAKALHDVLIAPIAADLAATGAQVLMVSSDAALRYVPFAALHDGERHLAQRISTALYVAAAREGVDNPPKPNWQITAMGVSQAHEGFSALPSVPTELRAVVRDQANPQGALPGERALDAGFTAAHLQSTLRGARPSVVHLATHYRFSPYGEHENFLLLGDGQRLTLHQFRTGPYRLAGVDLFTLSACETGVGAQGSGAEVEGLAAIAQKKGARAVMATLWPVADASTAQFMRRFYDARQREQRTKAQALRQTQIEMITGVIRRDGSSPSNTPRGGTAPGAAKSKPFTPDPNAPFSHPFYWAPFVLLGNWL